MKKVFIAIAVTLFFIGLGIWYLEPSDIIVLDSKGMIGKKERELIYTAALLMLLVVIPVFAFTWFFSWKYGAKKGKGRHTPDWEHNNIAECSWWGVPLLIIVILAVLTWKSTHELSPFKPIVTDEKPVYVQVVALEWKWLFIYPEEGIATVNYLQIPAKRPIAFEITADSPMNSFWIPQLGGMIYAMASRRSQLHLLADEEGSYRGLSSHFSGKGFAGMTFTAKATSYEEYRDWVSEVRGSSSILSYERYEELVKPTEYHPVETYTINERLFDRILEKYAPPKQKR